jgi:hypothetical protein
MIAIYELRGKYETIQTNEIDAQKVTQLMKDDKDYINDDNLKQFGGSVMDCEYTGIFTDSKCKTVISVCNDRKGHPARIQFAGLEGEVLSIKNILTEKLNKEGYRLS